MMNHVDSRILQLDVWLHTIQPNECARNEVSQKRDVAEQILINGKLGKLKLKNFKKAEEYCDEVQRLVNELKARGGQATPEDELLWLMWGLLKSLTYVRASAMASLQNGNESDMSSCCSLIISEAEPYNTEEYHPCEAALAATSRSCFKCGKFGHVQRFCLMSKDCGNSGNSGRQVSLRQWKLQRHGWQ